MSYLWIILPTLLWGLFVGFMYYKVFTPRTKRESTSSNVKPTGTLNGTPVTETEEGKLWLQIVEKGCPDCGSEEFAEGPQGGLMTNIECRNGHRFNVAPMLGIAHRI